MLYNPFTLEGKTVIVTGASSGIGKATAIECSKMGAKLIITGRNEERLNETFSLLEGEGHMQIVADLVLQDQLENLVSQVESVDGVVLCAGISDNIPFPYSTREKFDKMFNINFYSPVELLRLLYKKKKIIKMGSVVLLVSIAGTTKFGSYVSIYGSSKAALNAIMKYCAIEFSSRMIRVNSVCPGMVETPLIDGTFYTEEYREKDKEKYLLKRYGQPKDVAHGVIYLLSDASSWVTGHSLIIDGGISAK